jgi:hypothetical protein
VRLLEILVANPRAYHSIIFSSTRDEKRSGRLRLISKYKELYSDDGDRLCGDAEMVQANEGDKMRTLVTDARPAAKQAITNEPAVTGAGEEDLRTIWKKFGQTWETARELSYELWSGSPAVFQQFATNSTPRIVDSSPRRANLRASAAPTFREVEEPRFMEGQGNDSEFEYDDIGQINHREELRSHSDLENGRETEDMELYATDGDPAARAGVNDVSTLFVRKQHASGSDGQAEYLAGLPEKSAFRPPVEP